MSNDGLIGPGNDLLCCGGDYGIHEPGCQETAKEAKALALDVSLEKARALHRVWRALNDGDCPKCHRAGAATEMLRFAHESGTQSIRCPLCFFTVYGHEIVQIEKMFAPAMDAAVAIFETWRNELPK